jgi:hypothetical protein
VPTDRVPLWAAYWIVGGHDGEALVYLAGLHGDDPREVHDALPEALRDCVVEMPDSDVAAATVAFTHAARLHVDGLAGPRWVLSQVGLIVARSGYSVNVTDLPLGALFGVDDEWGAGWAGPPRSWQTSSARCARSSFVLGANRISSSDRCCLDPFKLDQRLRLILAGRRCTMVNRNPNCNTRPARPTYEATRVSCTPRYVCPGAG